MNLVGRIEKFKKNKGVVLFVSLATAIALISGLLSSGKEIKNFLLDTFLRETVLYEKIDKLNTGVQISYFNKLLDKPVIIRPWGGTLFPKYKEYIYVNDDFFVKSITDESNTVLYYGVTTRKQGFNPKLPYVFGEDLKLGKTQIGEIKATPENFVIDASSKFEYYHESYYFGNPGKYRSYLIGGYSPSDYSVDFNENKYSIFHIMLETNEKIKNKEIQVMRKTLVPNTYGVISESATSEFTDNIMQAEEISIDFWDSVKFFN
ncbi:ETEC_3214 domain-containing protein [Priestia aryabhattai]|uniref:ETEC_3214 domain-containing protein n=1 Tax=Priestia aryabhattai TaxID=412384 RepID=UPI0005EC0A37|nr:ETEC_3214 domain-containing protein [Priestia aryabhattai]KJL04353.1 hypothetical protein N178_12550 [Priestia aryabhattai B8W22]